MNIPIIQTKPGDVITFKGTGPAFSFFSALLCVFDGGWRKLTWKPWHMGIAWSQLDDDGLLVLEATGEGVKADRKPTAEVETKCRAYRWLDEPPSNTEMVDFFDSHINKRYDVLIYVWTTIQYLFRHFFNRRVPRLLDDRFTCWELAFEFCEDRGKPIGSKYDCPMITDFLRVVNEIPGYKVPKKARALSVIIEREKSRGK